MKKIKHNTYIKKTPKALWTIKMDIIMVDYSAKKLLFKRQLLLKYWKSKTIDLIKSKIIAYKVHGRSSEGGREKVESINPFPKHPKLSHNT